MVENRFQRWAGEVIFPLMGLLFWDWTFAFVAWFYFGDRFFQWGFNFFKKENPRFWKAQSLITLELLLILLLILQTHSPITTSLYSFLSFRDMGIPQGYFLVPLLLIGEVLKFSMEQRLKVFFLENRVVTLIKIGLLGICLSLFWIGITNTQQIIAFIGALALTNLWIDLKKVPVSYK